LGGGGGVGMQCKYVKQNGSRCQREALYNLENGYCILHEDLGHKNEEEVKKEFYKEIEEGITDFEGCILPEIDLSKKTIEGSIKFARATIEVYVSFPLSNISSLTFKNAKFNHMSVQGDACREAKITQERRGDRELADYHFYREMVAKRKRKYKTFSLKPILKLMRELGLEKPKRKHIEIFEKPRRIYCGFLELPVQYIFGYGVHPWRVITT